MAGATAEILLPDDSEFQFDSWRNLVNEMNTEVRGLDFTVAPAAAKDVTAPTLPFFWYQERETDNLWSFEPDELAPLRDIFGFQPGTSIGFGAMCRGHDSDLIPAGLADAFLSRHNGILLFHGLLGPKLDLAGWREWNAQSTATQVAAFKQHLGYHPGRLACISMHEEPSHHVADREFLRFWTAHPDFHFAN